VTISSSFLVAFQVVPQRLNPRGYQAIDSLNISDLVYEVDLPLQKFRNGSRVSKR